MALHSSARCHAQTERRGRCAKHAIADGMCLQHHPLYVPPERLRPSGIWGFRFVNFFAQMAIAALLQFITKLGPQYTFRKW